MTIDKKFKAVVRERMAHTGENYTSARRSLMEYENLLRSSRNRRRDGTPCWCSSSDKPAVDHSPQCNQNHHTVMHIQSGGA